MRLLCHNTFIDIFDSLMYNKKSNNNEFKKKHKNYARQDECRLIKRTHCNICDLAV